MLASNMCELCNKGLFSPGSRGCRDWKGEKDVRTTVEADHVEVQGATVTEKKQRWDREKYRAYQREYMRRRRASK